MITGKDKKSTDAIKMLNEGFSHDEIAERLDISINNVKRLSRFNNYINQSKDHLTNEAWDRMKTLGLKVLVLSSLFKTSDYEGLEEILTAVNTEIKRNDFKRMIEALERKREEMTRTENRVNRELERHTTEEKEIEAAIQELKDNKATQKKVLSIIIKCGNKRIKSFLEDHLGLYEGSIALKRKIDSNWEDELHGVIEYTPDKKHYGYKIAIIRDIQSFINSLKERLENGEKVRRYPKWIFWTPLGLDANISREISKFKNELKEIQLAKTEAVKLLESIKCNPITDYLNIKDEYTQYQDNRKIKLITDMNQECLKYLFDNEYVAVERVALIGNGEAPVAGYNKNNDIIMIDYNLHKEEYLLQKDWEKLLSYSNQLYFVLEQEDANRSYNFLYKNRYYYPYNDKTKLLLDIVDTYGIGILIYHRKRRNNQIEIFKKASAKAIPEENRKNTIFDIGRKISRKFVFGY